MREAKEVEYFQEAVYRLSRIRYPLGEHKKSGRAAIGACISLIGSIGAVMVAEHIFEELSGHDIGIGVASAGENAVITQDNVHSFLENMTMDQLLAEDTMPYKISNVHMTPNGTAYFRGKNTLYEVKFVGMGEDMEAKVTDLSINQTATAFLAKRGSYYDVAFKGNGTDRSVRISGHGFDGTGNRDFAKISAFELPSKEAQKSYGKTINVSGNSTSWQKLREGRDRLEIRDYTILYKGASEGGNKADRIHVAYKNRTAEIELTGRDPAAYVAFKESNYTLVVGGSSYKEKDGRRAFNLFARLRPQHKFEDLSNTKEAERELKLQ